MADVLSILFTVVNLVGFAGLLYITVRVYTISRLLNSSVDPAVGFGLLAASQLSGALVPVAEGRLAFSFYIASGVFTAASIAVLLLSPREKESHSLQIVPPLLAVPLASDLAALVMSSIGVARFSGYARILASLYTVAFVLRLSALLTLPSQESVLLLLAGEAVRGLGSAVVAVMYLLEARR
ncbi:MAG: hypothetical protein F7B20_05510 [Aeropyrum sp.]|nr:hypothetical protein [Aeropyrum sp.]